MNEELERTEELLAAGSDKKRKKKLAAVMITVAVLSAAIGVFAGIKIHSANQVKGYIATAETKFKEGNYEGAIASYEKIIKIDANNAKAYEGLGDAHKALGHDDKAYSNYKKATKIDKDNEELYKKTVRVAVVQGKTDEANELIDEMHKYISNTDDVDVSSICSGSTQENRLADGIVCQDGRDLYIANKPERGCITKVDPDGKEKVIVRNDDLAENESVRELNVWDGWIYYGICQLDDGFPETNYIAIKKVRTDGTEKMTIPVVDKYFPFFTVIQGKIYWGGAIGDGGWKVTCCDLDGSNKKEISKDTAGFFISDGEYIYYNSVPPRDSLSESSELRKINIGSGKEESLSRKQLNPIFVDKNMISALGDGGSGEIPAYSFDVGTEKLKEAAKIGYAWVYNIHEDNIIWTPENNRYIAADSERYEMEIRNTSLKTGEEGEPIKHTFSFEELFPEGTDKEDASACVNNYQIIGDKLYYSILIGSDNYDYKYGCMNTDGSNNEFYY